jgi:hypothetical protein
MLSYGGKSFLEIYVQFWQIFFFSCGAATFNHFREKEEKTFV